MDAPRPLRLVSLPREVVLEIMDHLTTAECLVLSRVSRAFAWVSTPGLIFSHDARLQKHIARVAAAENRERTPGTPNPLIMRLIMQGASSALLDEAVRVYARHFIDGFAGKWGHKDLVAPQFLAAWLNRQDVVDRIFQTEWVDHALKMSTTVLWQQQLVLGEGRRQPASNALWDNYIRPAGDAMIEELPGALLYAMYGSHDALALLLVQHYNTHQELTSNTPTVSPLAICGLAYLAARMNMPQLLRFLLNWGGVNVWAAQAGFTTTHFTNPTIAYLQTLYQIAAQGTRDLPYPESLRESRLRSEDAHVQVLADVYAEWQRVIAAAGTPPQPFLHGITALRAAIAHFSPQNAIYILNITIGSGVHFGVQPAGQSLALTVLREALLAGRYCPDMMQLIREVHPPHTASWLRVREAREKVNPPAALWHDNLPDGSLRIEEYLPSISSRMLSLAICHGGIDFARYILQQGAVPDEDHVMHTMWATSRDSHTTPGQFMMEKSAVIDLLVEHGLDVVQTLPRRFYHGGEWYDIGLGTIATTQDLPVATMQPMNLLQVAAHECLSFLDGTKPESFDSYMWNDRESLLFRSLALCRIVYHFLRSGGRIDPSDSVTRKRILGFGLMYFSASGESFSGTPRWEVKWPKMMTGYTLPKPDRRLAENAREGRWRPDISMLTGRGFNVHEQVLAMVTLLFLSGGESFFALAESWQSPNQPTNGLVLP